MNKQPNTQRVITIDGPAGAGKSTIASRLAAQLNASYLDTGAMYRAITLAAQRANTDLNNPAALQAVAQSAKIDITWQDQQMKIALDGQDVSEAIRDPKVTAQTSKVATNPAIRAILVDYQRNIATKIETLITEGRDQGTIVFPNATIKFYLDANNDERAQRRHTELQANGATTTIDEIQATINERDQRDTQRKVSPLKPADDAIRIDSTGLNIEQVVALFTKHINALKD